MPWVCNQNGLDCMFDGLKNYNWITRWLRHEYRFIRPLLNNKIVEAYMWNLSFGISKQEENK